VVRLAARRMGGQSIDRLGSAGGPVDDALGDDRHDGRLASDAIKSNGARHARRRMVAAAG